MSAILPYLLLFAMAILIGYVADYYRKCYLLFLEIEQRISALEQICVNVYDQQTYIIERMDRALTQDPDRTGKLMAILREIEERRLEGKNK